jgi:hypothetical protein
MPLKKKSKARISESIGLGKRTKNLKVSPHKTRDDNDERPNVAGLKDDPSRRRITREGNELRTFSPDRDAARRAAADQSNPS